MRLRGDSDKFARHSPASSRLGPSRGRGVFSMTPAGVICRSSVSCLPSTPSGGPQQASSPIAAWTSHRCALSFTGRLCAGRRCTSVCNAPRMLDPLLRHPRAPNSTTLADMANALGRVLACTLDPASLLADVSPWIREPMGGTLFNAGPWLALPNRPPRRYIGVSERRSLVGQFSATCLYCHRQGTMTRDADGKPWQADHYIPKARGGSCNPSNIVLSCYSCNYDKCDALWVPGHRVNRMQLRTIKPQMLA